MNISSVIWSYSSVEPKSVGWKTKKRCGYINKMGYHDFIFSEL